MADVLARQGGLLPAVAIAAPTSNPPTTTHGHGVPLPGRRLTIASAKKTASARFGTMPSAVAAK
jgi:hypothetical protein